MKKILSGVLAGAMAFSMFASAAFANEASLDTQGKYDALKAKGIFEGTDGGAAALDEDMTRAQFAKIVTLLAGLKEDASAASVYTDLDGAGWAAGFIGAATKAGYFDGVAPGKFDPSGKVTLEQLATVMVRVLGLQVDANATVSGTSDWAKGYVAAAIKAGVISSASDFTVAAKRSALVDSTYVAYNEIQKKVTPANVGIAEVKATGAKTLTVTFNGPVDTEKAKLELKRNGSTATATVKFAEDKKSATLTTDVKLIDATYEVTLSGIDNLDTAKAKASVVATKERVAKIEILTASETIPQADKVQIDFKATNQYGEVVDLTASNFTIYAGSLTATNVAGKQAFTLDTYDGGVNIKKGDRVPVTIIHQDSAVQANKIFVVGEEPIVAKVEVGDLKNSSDVKVDSIEAGKSAYLEYTAYDQYGVKVTDLATLNSGKGITVVIPDSTLTAGLVNGDGKPFVSSVVGNDDPDLQLNAKSDATAKDITITLFANGTGQSVQKVIKVATPKVPATVDFGTYTGALAKGDVNTIATPDHMKKNLYLPLVVKDEAGNTLTAQEIVDNASKFTVYATGGVVELDTSVTSAIETSGEHKGKIKIARVVNKGNATVVVQLKDKPNVQASYSISAGDERKPESLKVTKEPAGKILLSTSGNATISSSTGDVQFNSKSEFKVKTFDQYGNDAKGNELDASGANKYVNYKVNFKLEQVTGGTENKDGVTVALGSRVLNDATKEADLSLADAFDKSFYFVATTAPKKGLWRLTGKLIDTKGTVSTSDDVELSSFTRTIELIDGKDSNTNLTYTVKLDKSVDNSLLALKKYDSSVTAATYAAVNSTYPKVQKEVKVEAKDSSGTTVALPSGIITSITSSNTNVVGDDDAKYIYGIEKGTATVTVLFNTPKGSNSATLEVTVKEDAPTVESISFSKTGRAIAASAISGKTAWDAALGEKLTVKDQYGSEYINEKTNTPYINTHNALLGIRYFVSNIKYKSNTAAADQDIISIDPQTGVLTYTPAGAANDLVSFTITAIAPNGKSASIDVSVD